MPIRELTATSYAVLGLLAVRPWSSYELTGQMRRGLNRFWPRAQSKLYEEPKKLVDHGFATASTEWVGRRRRSVYTITSDGRRALTRWLGQPAQGPVLECEALLKVFFAEHGSRDELIRRLEELREWAQERMAEDARIAERYLDGDGPFPERLPILTLTGGYSWELAGMTLRWAEESLATVRRWPENLQGASVDTERLARIAAGADGSLAD